MKYIFLLLTSVSLSAGIFTDSPWSSDAQFVPKKVENDVLALDKHTFEEFIQQDLVVIKFYAEWCGMCRRFGATFSSVAEDLSEFAAFARLNTSTSNEIASKFKVRVVPTVVIFSHGVELKRHRGSMSEEALTQFIQSAITDR